MKNRRAGNLLVAFIGIIQQFFPRAAALKKRRTLFSPKKDQNFPDAPNRVPTDCGFAEVL